MRSDKSSRCNSAASKVSSLKAALDRAVANPTAPTDRTAAPQEGPPAAKLAKSLLSLLLPLLLLARPPAPRNGPKGRGAGAASAPRATAKTPRAASRRACTTVSGFLASLTQIFAPFSTTVPVRHPASVDEADGGGDGGAVVPLLALALAG